ncbi:MULTISPECIES: HlyD family secretion protein [Bradyrhizobium]|uniref:Multidrug resistance efflux pump n=1 Tax=Bradyrhizobium yuanmingense TaxID=108015 RepID=A0ABV4GF89_9BRAD|nr:MULTISPECIES: HlyD family secretion protein [Bradyrhizobium]MCA1391827.1 HlyD family efflux transporter periplasmic adaptor subunit [Bradyrhizobium sp. IC3123]MCA1428854.1 HlyD family efflux transporter periplasmic adaptor subunit [Bradyrhizobium sp. NBAIM16]MCA1501802.1 HlyD family efflux transporter periplasmic adaptor subunit [Bradyrhizobium sp. NBAIM14]MCA1508168.1 HlyD family efflux transporter periplasmic adaptor subunit [Bradyrhizobium sp. NBAIM02]MCA1530241.1 HlyD family efflux tran
MVDRSSAASVAPSSAPSPHDARTDAKGLQDSLHEHLFTNDESDHASTTQSGQESGRRWPYLRRGAKVAIGLAIVAVFGWLPLRAIWENSSVEAVLNSRLVTLRTPIGGRVAAAQRVTDQAKLEAGTVVLRVFNSRGDRTRLDDLRRQKSRLENERPSLAAKLASAQAAQKDLARQAALFRDGRVLQLEARIAEIQTSIEAAAARRDEASAAVERASSLAKSGNVSTVELARLTRELSVSQQTELGARKRLDAAKVELAAARNGSFLGDSYNDRPSSVQREEEMRQRAGDLEADLARTDTEIAWLANEIIVEEVRFADLTEANITTPVAGRVWEMMTSPGEDVQAGQPLLKVLDCSGAVITANVTENVYNRLQLGDHATFEPNDGGEPISGTVVNLTGAAGAPANLAINPDALSKEPYRVTVASRDAAARACTVGRTGRVVFARHETAP